LTTSISHAPGTFMDGSPVVYTVTGGNNGPLAINPTNGTVTIVITMPNGITPTGITGAARRAGAGVTAAIISGSPVWSCVLATLTCTTNSVIPPGADSGGNITINATIGQTVAPGTVLTATSTISGGAEPLLPQYTNAAPGDDVATFTREQLAEAWGIGE